MVLNLTCRNLAVGDTPLLKRKVQKMYSITDCVIWVPECPCLKKSAYFINLDITSSFISL